MNLLITDNIRKILLTLSFDLPPNCGLFIVFMDRVCGHTPQEQGTEGSTGHRQDSWSA